MKLKIETVAVGLLFGASIFAQEIFSIAPEKIQQENAAVMNLQMGFNTATNGIMELELGWPFGFSDRLEVFATTNLVSGDWQLARTNIVTYGSSSFLWQDLVTSNLVQRFYSVSRSDQDTDGDGLADGREGYLYNTDRYLKDTDGDGLWDGFEVESGFNPLSLPGYSEADEDLDGDGLPDPLENLFFGGLGSHSTNDWDGDGLLNGEEIEGIVVSYRSISVASIWVDMPTNASWIDWSEYYDDYDEDFAEVPIGFSFPLFNVHYTNVTIGVNGVLSFGGEFGGYDDVGEFPIINGLALVAPFWADLEEINGTVYYHEFGTAPARRFVVSWEDFSFFDEEDSSFYFQAELHESGEIEFRYGIMNGDGVEEYPLVVGIQSSGGSYWNQWLYTTNAPVSLTDGLALSFAPDRQVLLNSYPHLVDSDEDVMDDLFETQRAYLDPMDATDGGLDYDRDGLLNRDEYILGTLLDNPDSDGDRLGDLDEFLHMNDVPDPLNPTAAVASDMLADSDQDGMNNGYELGFSFLDPFDPSDGGYDSDMDGMPDELELLYFNTLNQTATNDFDGDGLLNGEEISTSEMYYLPPVPCTSDWMIHSNLAYVIDWADAMVITNESGNASSDEGFYPTSIGFDFPFYGSTYSNLYIGVNGCLSFGQAYGFKEEIPRTLPSGIHTGLTAPFWQDLATGEGEVRYQQIGQAPERHFMISWFDVEDRYFSSFSFSFQVDFHENGTVIFRYGDMYGLSFYPEHVIGLQGTDGISSSSLESEYWGEIDGYKTNTVSYCFSPINQLVLADPTLGDTDGDGMDDAFEVGSGFLDALDPRDAGYDYEGDGLINSNEYAVGTDLNNWDSDGDLLGDYDEFLHMNDVPDPLDPLQALESDMLADSDNDGIANGYELAFSFLNPFFSEDAGRDQDGDGVDNLTEYNLGSNLSNRDSDGDTLPDNYEVDFGTDPTVADDLDSDSDGDGLSLREEYFNGSNPFLTDSDDDGVEDGVEVAQGSNPVDATDNGIPPLAEDIEEVVFSIGGDYASWEMTVTGLGPDDVRIQKLRMSAPNSGQSDSLKLHRNNDYEITMQQLETKEGQEIIWWCWSASVDGHYTGRTYNDYDATRLPGVAENFVVGGSGGSWWVDNLQGLLTTHVHMSAGDGANIAGTTTAFLRAIEVEMITPAGNPITSPEDSIVDGQNEFTFSTANPGVLTMNLKALVTPSGVASQMVDQCYFTVGAIGSSTMVWDAANPGGKPIANGDYLEATVTFSGLPANNSDFGLKQAAIYFDGNKQDEKNYEVFFPKYEANHPGGQSGSPNWFHYWQEGNVAGIPSDAIYDPTADYGYVLPGVDTKLRLGPLAADVNSGPEIFDSLDLVYGSLTVTGQGVGVFCVAEVVEHELYHLTIYQDAQGKTDTDTDGVANTSEPSLTGVNSDSNNADTYRMRDVYGSVYASYGDDEVRCRKKELDHSVQVYPSKDWANPGSQNINQGP